MATQTAINNNHNINNDNSNADNDNDNGNDKTATTRATISHGKRTPFAVLTGNILFHSRRDRRVFGPLWKEIEG